jgi:hypothetical protein
MTDRQPDIHPRPDMLTSAEGICRYAARLGVVLFVTESGKADAYNWHRADDGLKAAVAEHRAELRALLTARRDEQLADQARMWAEGGPPWLKEANGD